MTIIFEISNPVQWKPGYYESRLMRRVWWLWFAVAVLRVSFREFSTAGKVWQIR